MDLLSSRTSNVPILLLQARMVINLIQAPLETGGGGGWSKLISAGGHGHLCHWGGGGVQVTWSGPNLEQDTH